MQLPAPLYRNKQRVHKNTFGHVLIIAGSKQMIGAAALTGLAALRSGSGLVTLAIPESLNLTLQKKINNSIMTLPLKETKEGSFDLKAFTKLNKTLNQYSAIAIGPGATQHKSTQKFIHKIIKTSTVPLIIDADGLNALINNLAILNLTQTPKILTPHLGEFSRLIKTNKKLIELTTHKYIEDFIVKYPSVTLLLKGAKSLVASQKTRIYTNKTGNSGMAKAGSGDVLTGIIASFIAQGIIPENAAKYGCYVHGLAGDIAAQTKSRTTMIPEDIINSLDQVFAQK